MATIADPFASQIHAASRRVPRHAQFTQPWGRRGRCAVRWGLKEVFAGWWWYCALEASAFIIIILIIISNVIFISRHHKYINFYRHNPGNFDHVCVSTLDFLQKPKPSQNTNVMLAESWFLVSIVSPTLGTEIENRSRSNWSTHHICSSEYESRGLKRWVTVGDACSMRVSETTLANWHSHSQNGFGPRGEGVRGRH